MITAERYHDISMGHKVTGHESKCAHLHGHNYRFHFKIGALELDHVGRVMDFSVIKEKLCMWLEFNWDHKFMIWEHDDSAELLKSIDPDGVVIVNFNPTAELMAEHFVKEIAPQQLAGTGCILVSLKIEETRKCSVNYEITG